MIASLALLASLAVQGTDRADAIIEEARAECAAILDGTLTVPEGAITRADLTGDETPDAVVDLGKVSCSTSASLFCGTGGCSVTLLAGAAEERVLSKGWVIERLGDMPVFLSQVHGSNCGGTNLRRCATAITFSEGAFQSVAPPPYGFLQGSEWRPEALGDKTVPDDGDVFIQFGGTGQVTGSGGCNRLSGSYEVSLSRVTFGPVRSTRKLCPEPVMDVETGLLEVLGNARFFIRDGIRLTLHDEEGHVIGRFRQTDWD